MENKIKAISEAMEYTGENPEKDTRANIYIIKPACDSEVKKVLMGLIYGENIGGSQDLSYQITARACDIVADLNEEDLKEDNEGNVQEYCNGVASVYIDERLEYLNNQNQHEITDELKSIDCDIQEACAIWYDNMVFQACLKLISFINE